MRIFNKTKKRETCMLCGIRYDRSRSRCPTCWGWADKEPETTDDRRNMVNLDISYLSAKNARIENLKATYIHIPL